MRDSGQDGPHPLAAFPGQIREHPNRVRHLIGLSCWLISTHCDLYLPPIALYDLRESSATILQALPTGKHHLKLSSEGGAAAPPLSPRIPFGTVLQQALPRPPATAS